MVLGMDKQATVFEVPLHSIIIHHNPRCPTPNLDAKGIDRFKIAHELGLSKDLEAKKQFVDLLEVNEPELIQLAESWRESEIQPVLLRRFAVEGELEKFSLICGERRFLCSVYLFARYGTRPVIEAIIRDCTQAEAEKFAVDENIHRKSMSDLELGEIFYKEVQKGMTVKEVAQKYHYFGDAGYQFVRGRAALASLPAERKNILRSNPKILTKLIREGLTGQKISATKPKLVSDTRRRVKTLKEVMQLVDIKLCAVWSDETKGYLTALAEIMGMTCQELINERSPKTSQDAA